MSEGFLLPKRETDFEGPSDARPVLRASSARPVLRASSVSPMRDSGLSTSELLYSGVQPTYTASPVYSRPVVSGEYISSSRISPSRLASSPSRVAFSADYGRPVEGYGSVYPVQYALPVVSSTGSYRAASPPMLRSSSTISASGRRPPSPPLINRPAPAIRRSETAPVMRAAPPAPSPPVQMRPESPTQNPVVRAASPAMRTVSPSSTRPQSPQVRIMEPEPLVEPPPVTKTEVFSVYQPEVVRAAPPVQEAPVMRAAPPPAPPPQQAPPPPPAALPPPHTRLRGDNIPLPYFGVKQEFNSPIDWGPYDALGTQRSWPGFRAKPQEGKVMTAFYYNYIGQKIPIKVTARETIPSLRQRIFQQISGDLEIIRHDDDVDERFSSALLAPPFRSLSIKDVKDVAADQTIPTDPHYSRPLPVDPESAPTDRVIRKRAPDVAPYLPPQRTPKTFEQLELYVGAAKIYDDEIQFMKSINTGAAPASRVCTIEDYNIGEGTVIKPEYKLFASDIKGLNPKQDTSKLGNLPTLNTIGDRIWGGLDPDFWAGTVEQAPRILADFFNPPGSAVDKGCGSNCERDGMPHVGRLVPAGKSRPASSKPRVFGADRRYSQERRYSMERPQPPGTQMTMV